MTAMCRRNGCERRPKTRGLCGTHYNAWWVRQTAYGRFESTYVDAAPVREHVRALQAAGMGLRQIAAEAGVGRKALQALTTGRPERQTGPSKKVTRTVAERVLAIDVPVLAPSVHVSALGTQRRLQALVAAGWTQDQLAMRLGVPRNEVSVLVVGRRTQCTATRAQAVAQLFAELQMIPGSSNRSIQRGRHLGWALPMEWDEDAIDDPDATPQIDRWSPSSSTAERREQVADLTAKGLSADQIADRLGVTTRTVTRDRSAA